MKYEDVFFPSNNQPIIGENKKTEKKDQTFILIIFLMFAFESVNEGENGTNEETGQLDGN